ncbi:MAG TPA: hypothetical protein VHE57_16150, partial [Mycobacteriales bacterium]|nr:hypothetical protein [Mycobacteriales bacterium]
RVAWLAVIAALVAAAGPAEAAVAARSDTGPAAPAASSDAFVPGNAVATSQAFQLDPRDAGLAATITLGRSVAQYRNSLAQASAQAIDLGVIGSTLTVQCGPTPAPLKPDQVPKPITAESNAGAVEDTENLGGAANQFATAVGGKSHVKATPSPNEDALASFDGGTIEVPGVVAVRGLSSGARAHLYEGHARLAESTADVARVDLGPIHLGGLHWETSVRTGSKPASSSTFTISTVDIGGTKLPTASTDALDSAFKAINNALAPTGLHVLLPEVSHDNGQLAMTPLAIGVTHSALGKMVLVPILNLVHTIFDPAANAINKALCTFGSVYSAANLMIAALDGIGQFNINLGGTTAKTDDTTYANPFGDGQDEGNSSTGTNLPPAGDTNPPALGGDEGGKVPPLPIASEAPSPVPGPQVAAGSRTVASSCSTTSPAGRPTCRRGAGLAVGLIALAALGGIAGADYFVVRRRHRLARMAIET